MFRNTLKMLNHSVYDNRHNDNVLVVAIVSFLGSTRCFIPPHKQLPVQNPQQPPWLLLSSSVAVIVVVVVLILSLSCCHLLRSTVLEEEHDHAHEKPRWLWLCFGTNVSEGSHECWRSMQIIRVAGHSRLLLEPQHGRACELYLKELGEQSYLYSRVFTRQNVEVVSENRKICSITNIAI